MSDETEDAPKPLHKNEQLKAQSNYLRGHILRDLLDESSGTITEESGQLTKFHGIYAQDDRDLRSQRRKEGREKAYIFMARVRVPGRSVHAAPVADDGRDRRRARKRDAQDHEPPGVPAPRRPQGPAPRRDPRGERRPPRHAWRPAAT
jgi:hypothetical protein